MYIKNGDIIVTSNINDLPLREIKSSQHLILLGNKKVGFFKDKEVDTSTSMVCVEKQDDLLCVMECNGSYVSRYYDNNDEEIEDIKLETEHYYRTYLDLKSGLYNLGDSERWERCYQVESLTDDNGGLGHEIKKYKRMYELIFRGEYSKNWFEKININNSSISFLPVEIDKDVCIVFSVSSSFFHFTKWNIQQQICIFQKDSKEVIVLTTDFMELYNKVKELKNDYLSKDSFEKFDDILKLIKYDIRKHVESSEEDKDNMINKLLGIAQAGVYKSQLEKLFSFFYENEKLNIKICIRSVKEFHFNCLLYKNNTYIPSYSYDEEMKIEVLKATALYNWDESNSKNGIDPRTGIYYKNGEIADRTSDFYEDAGGITYISNSTRVFYINYEGIFVQSSQYDQKVKDLMDRKSIAERLSS